MEESYERYGAADATAVTVGRTEAAPGKEALEQALTGIWKQVFSLEAIDPEDNFFALGGDSVTGMTLTERIAQDLGVHLPLVVVFQNPTIRELARAIDAA